MKRTYNLLIIIFAVVLISSCTEKIDINLDETYDRLIVEGNITTDTMVQSIYLSKTSSYFSNESSHKIEGAKISVTDNFGNETAFTEVESGKYSSPNNFFGIVGRNYKLKIELDKEISGDKYFESSSEIMAVNKIDSIGVYFNPAIGRNGYWLVQLYATDPAGIENFYMFNVINNGILMTDTLDKVSFTDDRLFDGNFTHGIGVAFFENNEEDQPFKVGDTVVLQMAGLNKNQFVYLNEVIQATSFQNPMFGGPPANVKGNISNGAFGYFGAYSTTYSSIILTEKNIEYGK